MKQLFTKQNELSMFINASPGNTVPAFFADQVNPGVSQRSASRREPMADLPDPQILRNILNYARSLEVMKPATGAAMFLINN
ncbi:MAG: hypothetical protein V2I46_08640 [Bacteroides sp.]|jgi:hypothetical protein|nr:hypothetical protein [Bacteroides sp.]